MIMHPVNGLVDVPGGAVIRGIPGITGTEDEPLSIGYEDIRVETRLGLIYRRGRSPHWLKVKNPKAPAVKREAEEDWGKQ
jgi:hypothetical protein